MSVVDNRKMLDEILKDESDRMTAWEVEFIESLDRQNVFKWTDKQIAILERIWRKLFG